MAKILLVEDEPDQAEMIKTRLEAGGYQVIVAGNGGEGIRLALEEKPALILMDMILPGMHGFEASIKLKENPETEDIPIIALTATGSAEFKQECLREGLCAFIKKPYDSKKLFKSIEKHINLNQKGTQIKDDGVKGQVEKEDGEEKKKIDDKNEQVKVDRKKQIRFDKEEARAEIVRKIDAMLKDALSEFGLDLEKKSPLVHEKEKELERAEVVYIDGPKAEEKERSEEKREKKQIAVENIEKEQRIPEKIDKTILIIEDEAELVNMIAMRLKKHGYEVISASDGTHGIRQAHKEMPDLILLDMVMPAGGGTMVFENLKRSNRTMMIPIILMTAQLSPKELEKKAAELGAEDFIQKPFESEELLRKIKNILGV